MDLKALFAKYKNILTCVLVLVLLTGASLAIYDHFNVSKPQPGTDVVVVPKGDVVITGPAQVTVGQLARLDVTKSNAKTFKWQVLPKTDNFVVYDEGQRAVFSAPTPGEYTFIVAGAGGPNGIDIQYMTIKVVASGATPPGPGPAPGPVVSELTGKVAEWAQAVTTPTAKAEAAKLADAFSGVKAQIGTALKTPTEISAAQQTANRAALGTSLQAWVPVLEKIQAAMKEQALAGIMVTPEQHATVWGEIADGLKLASK